MDHDAERLFSLDALGIDRVDCAAVDRAEISDYAVVGALACARTRSASRGRAGTNAGSARSECKAASPAAGCLGTISMAFNTIPSVHMHTQLWLVSRPRGQISAAPLPRGRSNRHHS